MEPKSGPCVNYIITRGAILASVQGQHVMPKRLCGTLVGVITFLCAGMEAASLDLQGTGRLTTGGGAALEEAEACRCVACGLC